MASRTSYEITFVGEAVPAIVDAFEDFEVIVGTGEDDVAGQAAGSSRPAWRYRPPPELRSGAARSKSYLVGSDLVRPLCPRPRTAGWREPAHPVRGMPTINLDRRVAQVAGSEEREPTVNTTLEWMGSYSDVG